jgi:Amidohydrolase family
MKPFAAAWIFLVSTLVFTEPAWTQDANRTWVTDVTIISPENLAHIERGSILIENGRIAKIHRGGTPAKTAGATVVPGKGQFLIPGLIDSHVHLASVPGMSFDQTHSVAAILPEYYAQLPRSYLYYGYTAVVDLAVVDRKVLEDFRRTPLHPDLYTCGESLPFANGYPMSFAPSEVRFKVFPNFIYDPKQASTIPPEYRPEDHTPEADVARDKREGAVCVKTYFERGFGPDRNLPVMSADVLTQIRQAATKQGLVLMIHANSFEAQKFGVAGDVDVLAHGMWNWGSLSNETELPAEISVVLDQIIAKNIGYQPTIQVLQGLEAYFDPNYLKTDGITKVVPKDMMEWFNSPDGKWFKKELENDDAPDDAVLKMYDQGPVRHVRQVVAYLATRDADFLFGTDTPSSPTYGNVPGLNGYLEMQQLHKAGMSLEQIFRAATISNARKFKLDSEMGTIEQGKIANLVLLKKSPLESLDAYDSITTVWVHGKTIPRQNLAADSKK